MASKEVYIFITDQFGRAVKGADVQITNNSVVTDYVANPNWVKATIDDAFSVDVNVHKAGHTGTNSSYTNTDIQATARLHEVISAQNAPKTSDGYFQRSDKKHTAVNSELAHVHSFNQNHYDIGVNDYKKGVVYEDKIIYSLGKSSQELIEFNTITKTTRLVGGVIDTSTVISKNGSGLMASNGCIYFSPYYISNIIKYDPLTETASIIPAISGYISVCEYDNKLYFTPFDSTRIMELDLSDDSIRLVGSELNASYRFIDIIPFDGKLYLMPSSYPQVVEYNPITETTTPIGPTISGRLKTGAWVLANNGKVYSLPYNVTYSIVYDLVTRTYTTIGGFSSTILKYASAELVDGKIYMVSRRGGNNMAVIDTMTDTVEFKSIPYYGSDYTLSLNKVGNTLYSFPLSNSTHMQEFVLGSETVLSLTPNTIQYDKNMIVKSWQNEAEGHKDIVFKPNDVDYENAGVGDVIVKGDGAVPSSVTNSFIYYEDTNEYFNLNNTNTILNFNAFGLDTYTLTEKVLYKRGTKNSAGVDGLVLTVALNGANIDIKLYLSDSTATNTLTLTASIAVSSLDTTSIVSIVKEGSVYAICVDNILKVKNTFSFDISNTNKFINILGEGNGDIDNRCIPLTLINLEQDKNTFFDLANKSVGDTIDTGFKPFLPIPKYRLKTQNCGYYALTNNRNAETIDNTTYINSVKSEQSNIDLIKHASYISPKVVKQGFDFAETGSSIYIPSAELIDIGTNDFLFQCWVKPNTLHNLFSRGNGLFGLYLSTNTITITNTSISTTVSGIESSEFKHIAIFREGTNAVICVNGVIKSIDTLSDNITGLGDLFIGRYDSSDSTHRFNGLITNIEFNNEDSIYSLGSLSVGDKLFNPPMRNSNRKDR